MNFQDELRKNMITKEDAKKAELLNVIKEREQVLKEAEYIVADIKRFLIENAKKGNYSVQNGKNIVSCTYELRWDYMSISEENNLNQIIENDKKFFLFRDPNLIYRSWSWFNINPKHRKEFLAIKNAVIEVAEKDNINIEIMVIDRKNKILYEFPCKIDGHAYYSDYGLVIKASTEA